MDLCKACWEIGTPREEESCIYLVGIPWYMSWGTHRKPFAHRQKIITNRNFPPSAHLKKKVCQENSYPGPPRHFPSARGWSLNICCSSAHERLTSTLVCIFSHPISKGNVLIGWRSYLQDAIVRAASRYLASKAGDDVLGITPALCNQPRRRLPHCYLALPGEESGCKLTAGAGRAEQLRRKDFISPFKAELCKDLCSMGFSSLARLKMLRKLGGWSLLQLLK